MKVTVEFHRFDNTVPMCIMIQLTHLRPIIVQELIKLQRKRKQFLIQAQHQTEAKTFNYVSVDNFKIFTTYPPINQMVGTRHEKF